jgi:hypothetical protein
MFTFGTDPEFMLHDGRKHKSAVGIVPGSKKQRHEIDGHSYYYDNVLAECAVPPASSKEEAIAIIRKSLQQFADLVKPHKLLAQAAQTYEDSELKTQEALKAGCDPEICAYSLDTIDPPNCDFKNGAFWMRGNLRTAGGHIHLGCPLAQQGNRMKISITRMMDLFLGTASIFIDHDPTSSTRKRLYGKAGRYRKPPHGVEYRSLGNFWLTSPKLVSLVYDICDFTLTFVEIDNHLDMWFIDDEKLSDPDAWNDPNFDSAQCHQCVGYDVDKLREAIDEHSSEKGMEFLNLILEILPNDIGDRIVDHGDPSKCGNLYEEWDIK